MTTDKEQTNIRLERESMAVLRGICERHGWTTGQAVSELCLFYKRIQEKMEEYHVGRLKDGTDYVAVLFDGIDSRYTWEYPDGTLVDNLVIELKKDVRNAFRKSEKQGE